MGEFFITLLVIIGFIALCSIKQSNQYERGILFKMGKYSKVLNPGWHVVWPIFQSCTKIDIRTRAVDVPEQVAITSDNVSIKINAVIYYKVFDAGKAYVKLKTSNMLLDNLLKLQCVM